MKDNGIKDPTAEFTEANPDKGTKTGICTKK